MRGNRNAGRYALDPENHCGTRTNPIEFYPLVWTEIKNLPGLTDESLFPSRFPVPHLDILAAKVVYKRRQKNKNTMGSHFLFRKNYWSS